MSEAASTAPDGAELARRARALADEHGGRDRPVADAARLDAYRAALKGAPEVLLASECAVELGSPRDVSGHAVLWTEARGIVQDGRAVVVGPDLGAPGSPSRDYAQIVIVEVAPGPVDPFRLGALQFLTRRLPGLTARMLPGRLWLRASRAALAAGLDFALLGAALRTAYLAEPGVQGVECVFASGDAPAVTALAAVAAEARARAGQHMRLSLGADGALECVALDCDACDEQPVCDTIREAAAIRRRAAPPSTPSVRESP